MAHNLYCLKSKEIYTTMIHKFPPPLGQVMFEKPSIEWTSFQLRPILMLYNEGILTSVCCNDIRTYPHVIKLPMFIFPRSIPLQNQILNLELFFLYLPIKSVIHPFLMYLHFTIGFVPQLIQLYDLIYSSLHMIMFISLFLR